MRRVLLAVLAACTSGQDDDPTPPVTETDTGVGAAVTYHRDVRPIFDEHCTACHAPGGIGPFDMTWRDDATEADRWWFASAVAAVAAGTMPPWLPDEACHPHEHPRVVREDQRALLDAWVADGFPLGRPADYVPPPPPDPLPQADLELRPADAYVADRARPDDYRCFVIDHTFERDLWVTGFDVAPGRVDLVHHVLLYRLDAARAADVAAWDAADEGPGYTCFGSPGTDSAETVAGWAPGQRPEQYARGAARRIPKGSVLVMQVHYNLGNVPPAAPVPADHTGVRLWTLPEDERPRDEIFSLPFPHTGIVLPAGDPDVVQELEVDLDFLTRWVRVRGSFPHMHQLGRSLRVDVLREDGTEKCLVDIPRWDFHWQQTYLFSPRDPIEVGPRDRLRLRCTYDNSAANQPVVNGVQQEPREVTWGEGTGDEMCLVYVYVTLPAPLD